MRFDRDRLIFLALLVLDETCDAAGRGAVKPSFSIRLALASLYALSEGERRVFEDFWREMKDPHSGEGHPSQGHYLRSTLTRTAFTGIARSVGVALSIDYCDRLRKARRGKGPLPAPRAP